MPRCRLFSHFIWETKNRRPWIIPGLEPVLDNAIRSKAIGLGARLYVLNACRDHIQTVVSIPPALSIFGFIGQVKGVSSLRIRESRLLPEHFRWQEEYGVFSLGESQSAKCISYVEGRKEHHAR
jgi:putative transposase